MAAHTFDPTHRSSHAVLLVAIVAGFGALGALGAWYLNDPSRGAQLGKSAPGGASSPVETALKTGPRQVRNLDLNIGDQSDGPFSFHSRRLVAARLESDRFVLCAEPYGGPTEAMLVSFNGDGFTRETGSEADHVADGSFEGFCNDAIRSVTHNSVYTQ